MPISDVLPHCASLWIPTLISLFLFRKHRENIPISLTKDEISLYVKRFNGIDREKKGYITVNDMTRSMQVSFLMPQKNER